ncbi:MAG: DNA mismatch repair endonuclease MutL [Prevotella sp.]|nr:DNA mismatch repair endonuclease MutL [Prevotella sp.]
MSDIIQLLPDSVANQIAAGEVIQRPASVIKELVENAIDAEATKIDVLVVDAGRTLIQVIDNGKGMSATDARLCFERHATSKIRQATDLFALHTMGFRGEALASIAAVAQVELKTRVHGDDVGTQLTIAGSRFMGQEICACPEGSNFKVDNLFYNVPARRKFLKSNSTEMNNIIAAFQRIVLVNPQVEFTLHSNGSELFCLRAGNQRQRIVDVFGKKINQDLLPLSVDTVMCRISGFVGKPEAARKKSVPQFFFANNRYMRHPFFHRAVTNAYERLLPAGEQIPYFIYIDVPAEDIDVNIHPVKTEIKFENEQAIFQMLSAAVKEALGKFNDVPMIDFDTQGRPDIPVFNPQGPTVMPQVKYNPQYNPFRETPSTDRQSQDTGNWEELYKGMETRQPQSQDLFVSKMDDGQASVIAEKSPAHYQYKGRYIMTAVKSGLMIVDQHRAHTRILYEEYINRDSSQHTESQKVLFPEIVEMPVADSQRVEKVVRQMQAMGFELTSLGGSSYAVNAIPAGLDGLNVATLVGEMVAGAMETDTNVIGEVRKSLALSLARNAAIPYGQVLSNEEMEHLVNSLFACSDVNHTPDGKQILNILPQKEIDSLF